MLTGMAASEIPDVLWTPDPHHVGPMTEFMAWVREHRGVTVPDYTALHSWSVEDLDGFWSAVAEFEGVRFHSQPSTALGAREMPGAEWFPGARRTATSHSCSPVRTAWSGLSRTPSCASSSAGRGQAWCGWGSAGGTGSSLSPRTASRRW